MKKNKMMRIAAVLLIVTLLSTCAISGTFAKYVAKADFEDSARVAKWGIKIETNSSLFSDRYATEDDDYFAAGGTYSVKAANATDTAKGDMVVAPGTSSDQVEDGGFVARLYGKPEVATRFQFKAGTLEDIFVPFGTYTDYSVAVKDGVEQTFDYTAPPAVSGLNNNYVAGYSPVKWDITVTRVKDDGTDGRSISLSDMASEVAGTELANLKDSLFTAEGVSITDAKTIVAQVKRLGLEDTIMAKVNEKFAGHGFRNLVVDIDSTTGEVTLSMDFDPNENVNYRFEAGWAWAFEQTAPSFITSAPAITAYEETCDKLDTLLGNVADGIIVDDRVKTNLSMAFEASATQID